MVDDIDDPVALDGVGELVVLDRPAGNEGSWFVAALREGVQRLVQLCAGRQTDADGVPVKTLELGNALLVLQIVEQEVQLPVADRERQYAMTLQVLEADLHQNVRVDERRVGLDERQVELLAVGFEVVALGDRPGLDEEPAEALTLLGAAGLLGPFQLVQPEAALFNEDLLDGQLLAVAAERGFDPRLGDPPQLGDDRGKGLGLLEA